MKILVTSLLTAALFLPGPAPSLAEELNVDRHSVEAVQQAQSQDGYQYIGEGITATLVHGEARIQTDEGIAFRIRVEETSDSIAFAFVPENEVTKNRINAIGKELRANRSSKSAIRGKRYIVATQYFYGKTQMERLKKGELTEGIVAGLIAAVGALVGFGVGGAGGAAAGSGLAALFSSLVNSKITANNSKIDKWIEDKTNRGIRARTVASSKHARPSTWKIELTVVKCPWDRRRGRYQTCQGI